MAENIDGTGREEETCRHEAATHEKFLLLIRELREQLDRALAREQEARRETQQFMYMLSHDLRSPMSTVSNLLGIILTKHSNSLDEKSKEYIGYALDGIKNMGQLLTDILYYAKTGARAISPGDVDCNRVLERALINLHAEIEKKKAEVTATGNLPVIKGDETLLVQVFQNLMANSLKFTEGVPRIEISAGRGGSEWVFSFKDNGIGIKPEDQKRIFDPFERARILTASKGGGIVKGEIKGDETKGTGLGLAICKRIVELHGGRIWVESSPGQGSTFHFTVPEVKATPGSE